jgi:rhodanese-related sulfurtransferase
MKKVLLSLLLITAGILFVATSASAEVQNINNETLEKMIADGVPVIDIRRAEEWNSTGVIDGSHRITFFDKKGGYDLLAWLKDFLPIAGPKDQVILICRTGNRTSSVSRLLDEQLGYQHVMNVEKGITEWIAKGKPVVKP